MNDEFWFWVAALFFLWAILSPPDEKVKTIICNQDRTQCHQVQDDVGSEVSPPAN